MGFHQRPYLREVHFVARPAKPPSSNVVCAGSILLHVEGVESHTRTTGSDFSHEMARSPLANAGEARVATAMRSHLNGS
jgi:hypothetical protein